MIPYNIQFQEWLEPKKSPQLNRKIIWTVQLHVWLPLRSFSRVYLSLKKWNTFRLQTLEDATFKNTLPKFNMQPMEPENASLE